MTLKQELHQTRPFATLEDEIFIGVLRTADHLLADEVRLLRRHALTFPLYNVLRILRGAGEAGLSCSTIAERMVTRDSDITRLLDRLERGGLVARERTSSDRRVIVTRLTAAGSRLLSGLDAPVKRIHREQLRHVTRGELKTLTRLLDRIRERPASRRTLESRARKLRGSK